MNIQPQTAADIRATLLSMQDEKYRDFQSRLMPTVEYESIIGIRTPLLRKYAATVNASPARDAFLAELPHKFYEENNLHIFLIEKMKDFNECIAALDRFLPFVNNWATCDSASPAVFLKNKECLVPKLKKWLLSDNVYNVRFAVKTFMNLFLDGSFSPEYPALIAAVSSEEYYVKMAVAWYFATALAKQYDFAVEYVKGRRLDTWIHNKAIQKALESYRIPPERKQYLKDLKIKTVSRRS